jgi:uncharacterized membrane protein YkoI
MSSAAVVAVLAGHASVASGAVGFLGAHDAAVTAFPSDVVVEIERSGSMFVVETVAGSLLREIEINGSTGGVLSAELDTLEADAAAAASAFGVGSLTWPEAISLAEAGPLDVSLSLLELELRSGGLLVFEAYYVDGSGTVAGSIEFDAVTGGVIDSDFADMPGDPGEPGQENLGLIGAITAAEAATGLVAIGVEQELGGAKRYYEVILADAGAQTVLEVDVDAATGVLDDVEPSDDFTWPEASQVLAMLPAGTIGFGQAIDLAQAATGGVALEVEYGIEDGGRLVYDVELATDGGLIDVDIDAVTGAIVSDEDDPAIGDQPGSGAVTLGVLDAMVASENANPGLAAFSAELEFSGGAFEWDVELASADGTAGIEVDIDAATGRIDEADASTTGAAEAAFILGDMLVDRASATQTAIAALGSGFIYELDIDREAGRPVWEVGVLFDGRRFEVIVDGLSGAVVASLDRGPAHITFDDPADGAPIGFGLFSLTPGDANDDDVVGVADLLAVLAGWGTASADADLDFDGRVGSSDLLVLLAAWGVTYGG